MLLDFQLGGSQPAFDCREVPSNRGLRRLDGHAAICSDRHSQVLHLLHDGDAFHVGGGALALILESEDLALLLVELEVPMLLHFIEHAQDGQSLSGGVELCEYVVRVCF